MNWRDLALCAQTDPEIFFPQPGAGTGYEVAAARRLCLACTVRAECLQDAMDTHDRFGIRGGLTAKQRQHAARQETAA